MTTIITGGCETRHPSSYRMSRPNGLPHFVILIIRTYGEFQIGSEAFNVTPPHILIIAPNTPYSYSNPNGEYMDDWFQFKVSESQEAEQLLPMCNKPFPIDNHALFTFCIRQLLWEINYGQPDFSPSNINALLTLFFNHVGTAYLAKDNVQLRSPYITQLQHIRLEMENSTYTTHSIQKYAQQLNISESYFQYLYKSLFGISFQQDLIQFRVAYAKHMISTCDLPLEQIAEACGYSNEIHFYRQFKKLTGTTPAKYRKSNSTQP